MQVTGWDNAVATWAENARLLNDVIISDLERYCAVLGEFSPRRPARVPSATTSWKSCTNSVRGVSSCRLSQPNEAMLHVLSNFIYPFIHPSIGIEKQRGGALQELSNERKALSIATGFV